MIYEAVVTTRNTDGSVHITPLGYTREGAEVILAPFVPSHTERNLRYSRQAVINLTDNVSIIAGCLTGRRQWPTVPSKLVHCERLEDTLSFMELEVNSIEDDETRPRFHCRVRRSDMIAPFRGFNRAKSAVLEAAILVSRLQMLPMEKVDNDIAYLKIAIEKTGGAEEKQAFDWLMEKIRDHQGKGPVDEGIVA